AANAAVPAATSGRTSTTIGTIRCGRHPCPARRGSAGFLGGTGSAGTGIATRGSSGPVGGAPGRGLWSADGRAPSGPGGDPVTGTEVIADGNGPSGPAKVVSEPDGDAGGAERISVGWGSKSTAPGPGRAIG